MRIIAGKWRGVPLIPPRGPQTRPIIDRVKESVFNILGASLASPGRLPPCRVLDLFAGTGSLGLEALSRGAAFCTFVEQHKPTAAILKENLAKVHATTEAQVCIADLQKMSFEDSSPASTWDLVFLDPPYVLAGSFAEFDPIPRILGRLLVGPILRPEATIVLRHPKSTPCNDDTFSGYQLTDSRTYGQMTVSFLELRSGEQE